MATSPAALHVGSVRLIHALALDRDHGRKAPCD